MSSPAAPSLSYIEPEALAEVLRNDKEKVVKVVDVRGEVGRLLKCLQQATNRQ
jgi:hypothetical protein